MRAAGARLQYDNVVRPPPASSSGWMGVQKLRLVFLLVSQSESRGYACVRKVVSFLSSLVTFFTIYLF